MGPRGTLEQLAAPTRVCKTCGQTKPREDFYLRTAKQRTSGRYNEVADRERRCKECMKARAKANARAWRQKYPERRLARFRRWKFGLTTEAFETLWADQEGRCGICRTPLDRTTQKGTKALHVDHDHRCCDGTHSCGNCIRGLLCPTCNLGLGSFHDDPDVLRAAIVYLTKPAA